MTSFKKGRYSGDGISVDPQQIECNDLSIVKKEDNQEKEGDEGYGDEEDQGIGGGSQRISNKDDD